MYCYISRLMVSYQGFESLLGCTGGTEEKTLATTAETQAQSPVLVPPAWLHESNKHNHVHWWESNEGSCLCCFNDSFLLVMSECNLGDHIDFHACYGCSLVGVKSSWRHHVYPRVCGCLHPLQANSGLSSGNHCWELAIPNWEAKRPGEGKLIKCVGRCDSSVCFVCGTSIPTR